MKKFWQWMEEDYRPKKRAQRDMKRLLRAHVPELLRPNTRARLVRYCIALGDKAVANSIWSSYKSYQRTKEDQVRVHGRELT